MNKSNIIPLPRSKVIYTGENNEYHLHGETYTVVETGYHWIKEFGYVIWITTEENKETTDVDYCASIDIKYLKKYFYIQ